MTSRFLLMPEVAEELSVSLSQVYHMVRSGELPAIKIGGRGQWRIERAKLEEYIARKYHVVDLRQRGGKLVGHILHRHEAGGHGRTIPGQILRLPLLACTAPRV